MPFDPSDLTINQKAVLATLSKLPYRYRRDRRFFEKILFLVTKSQPEVLEDIEATFEGYKMGPYNEFVDELNHHLEDYGLLQRMDVTPEGARVAKELESDEELNPVLKSLRETLDLTRDFNVNDLLYFVYSLYPDFARNSQFPEEARSEKLEHFTIAVSKLAEGQSLTVTSDKGSTLSVTLRGGKIEFNPVE